MEFHWIPCLGSCCFPGFRGYPASLAMCSNILAASGNASQIVQQTSILKSSISLLDPFWPLSLDFCHGSLWTPPIESLPWFPPRVKKRRQCLARVAAGPRTQSSPGSAASPPDSKLANQPATFARVIESNSNQYVAVKNHLSISLDIGGTKRSVGKLTHCCAMDVPLFHGLVNNLFDLATYLRAAITATTKSLQIATTEMSLLSDKKRAWETRYGVFF